MKEKILSINGLPGIGKTALAAALAYDPVVRDHFRDGILWARLGPQAHVQGQLRRWGTLLGISPAQMATLSNDEAWAGAIRTAIGSRHMLLILDDAWKIEECLLFNIGAPHCAYMVTTRLPLLAHWNSDVLTVPELDETDSMELLRHIAPQVVNDEAGRLHDLVLAAGGLPLALTIMGSYLRRQAHSGQARRITAALERLRDTQQRLQLHKRCALGEHPSLPQSITLSLQSIIAVSVHRLDDRVRSVFSALSVFPAKPQSFSEEAALVVAACTVEDLDVLTDVGLLESCGDGRYTLHQTIADYARLQQVDPTPMERFLAYISRFVEGAHDEQLDRERANVISALDAAYTHGKKEPFLKIFCCVGKYLLDRGNYQYIERFGYKARDIAIEHHDVHQWCETLLILGEWTFRIGKYSQAEVFLEMSILLTRRCEQKKTCTLLASLGRVFLQQGKWRQAERQFNEALSGCTEETRIELLNSLGTIDLYRNSLRLAQGKFAEALTVARTLRREDLIGTVLINLAHVQEKQGELDQAESTYQQCLAIARRTQHVELISAALYHWGGLALTQKSYDQSRALLQEGLSMARQSNHTRWIGLFLVRMAHYDLDQQRYGHADLALQEGLQIAEHVQDTELLVSAYLVRADLSLAQCEPGQAEELCQQALNVSLQNSQRAAGLSLLAKIANQRGDVALAKSFSREQRYLVANRASSEKCVGTFLGE